MNYVPTGGYVSDNSKTSPSARVLEAWRRNAVTVTDEDADVNFIFADHR